MKEISLRELLEAGCHFGHKVERWHPKAASFIYQAREGIHIIDLAKTKAGLKVASQYVKELGELGKLILFVATKRQSKGVVTDATKRAALPYLTSRWVGGFLTNWETVKKNLDKMNRLRKERTEGSWKKFPKHEIVQLEKLLRQLEVVYAGVADLVQPPDALFIVDIKKEHISVAEAQRRGLTTVAIVDTNANPTDIDYAIPANDDAVGSIQYIVNYLADAYMEGRAIKEKKSSAAKAMEDKEGAQKAKEEKLSVVSNQLSVKEEKREKVEKGEKAEKKEKGKKSRRKVGIHDVVIPIKSGTASGKVAKKEKK